MSVERQICLIFAEPQLISRLRFAAYLKNLLFVENFNT